MRKTILYIAMSLDGFIADPAGGVDWLQGEQQNSTDPGSYPDFIQTVDTVLLGHTTYRQIITALSPDVWPYAGMQSYVLTHQPYEDQEDLHFTSESPESLLVRLKKTEGKDIWICGGANLINQLMSADLIDRYWITLIPTLLGDGIRLFHRGNPTIPLTLHNTQTANGMVDLLYDRR